MLSVQVFIAAVVILNLAVMFVSIVKNIESAVFISLAVVVWGVYALHALRTVCAFN